MNAKRRAVRHLARHGWCALAGLALFLAPSVVAAVPTVPLRIDLTSVGNPHIAGDRATVTATVTNSGTLPLRGVVVMLSLLDRSRTPAVPLSVEDWTAMPEAGHVASLGPGHTLERTWPLRMVQSGRLAVLATAVVSDSGTVSNSAPLAWDIAPVRNLRLQTVIPTIIGVPLLVVAGCMTSVWRRRAETTR
jgi:hypothetical protein